jgi:formylglycine-generating enzyme required for sulfatase activity
VDTAWDVPDGSPETERGRYDDEGPQRAVTLTCGSWLGETSVTQALWVAVMGSDLSRFRGGRMGENPSRFQDDRRDGMQ